MASHFETGHAKNVANIEKYHQFLGTLGADYNPPSAAISAAVFASAFTTGTAKINAIKANEEAWKTDTNSREIIFAPVGQLSTRLLATLKSTGAPQQTIDDMASLVSKLRGDSKTSKPVAVNPEDPAAEPPVTRSSSQRSYDQQIENFSKMILLLENVAIYTPNESDLKVASLQVVLQNMILSNTKATGSDANLRASRIDRDKFLYAPDTGVLDLIKKSKAYILGLYGKTSREYKAAINYKFVRVVKK